ncbi:MAG: hypothetical protein N2Z21_05310 [Candidatus Sumerlaeaceae bacterium]|nr:hypothetical protein [Candidatus Sumerlaeaceae bacterium]
MFFLKYILRYLRRYYRVEHGLEYVEALRHLNKPSEVTVPNELIPAGVLMQLRGFMNLHVLNLHSDWVWPFWMERQSEPHSPSFIPRAMNLTYVNLTHRDWTGVGYAGGHREAIVDPRGLVTPWENGWSLDTWLFDGHQLHFPSRLADEAVRQWRSNHLPWVFTALRFAAAQLLLETFPIRIDNRDYVVQQVLVRNPHGASKFEGGVVFSVRPANPEGVSLIRDLAFNSRGFWLVNGELGVILLRRPDRWYAATHERGDVVKLLLGEHESSHTAHCPAGLCTGASFYNVKLAPGQVETFIAVMPLEPVAPRVVSFEFFTESHLHRSKSQSREAWEKLLDEGMSLTVPDARLSACFEANRATLLLLHDGANITAGPFTYHRHWFRDAAFMLNALEKLGYNMLCRQVLATYPARQWKNGYFCAQKGEWDSNGEAIWSLVEHARFTRDMHFLGEVYPAIRRGAQWIEHKRHDVTITKKKPRGLLPAGFSAEHLGPNDFYYWDNFWSLRGLLDAAEAATLLGNRQEAEIFKTWARNYEADLKRSIEREIERNPAGVLPAAPGRPPDAGMIGNICAAYPLALYDIRSTPWLEKTVRFIRDHLFHGDGFYQEMIHSGVNSYLTLQMAQCLLLLDDPGAFDLINYMLQLGSPTLCWPEAIHPRTRGGCMGDAHHGWAAAEWVLLLRSLIVVERSHELHITPCVPEEWYHDGTRMEVQRAPTYFGTLDLAIKTETGHVHLSLQPQWSSLPDKLVWVLPRAVDRVVSVSPADATMEIKANAVILSPAIREVTLAVREARTPPRAPSAGVPGLEDFFGDESGIVTR